MGSRCRAPSPRAVGAEPVEASLPPFVPAERALRTPAPMVERARGSFGAARGGTGLRAAGVLRRLTAPAAFRLTVGDAPADEVRRAEAALVAAGCRRLDPPARDPEPGTGDNFFTRLMARFRPAGGPDHEADDNAALVRAGKRVEATCPRVGVVLRDPPAPHRAAEVLAACRAAATALMPGGGEWEMFDVACAEHKRGVGAEAALGRLPATMFSVKRFADHARPRKLVGMRTKNSGGGAGQRA